MRNIFLCVGLAVFIAMTIVASNLVPASGALNNYAPLLVDQCNRLDIAPGTEDIAIDHKRNVAFVGTADRRHWYNHADTDKATEEDGIYLVDLANPSRARKISPATMSNGFFPHGIDYWESDDGERRLFVVNHPPSGAEIVEIFEVEEDHSLTHIDSVSFDEMYSPNDVVGVGPRQFYATNDRRYDSGFMAPIELYFALPLTDVVFFDGAKGSIVAKGLRYANGVNVSPDGARLYVAEVLKRRLSVFDRDPATNALRKTGHIKLNTSPDNIDVDAQGDLWIGGHPQALKFEPHAKDPASIAPSHVVKVDAKTGETNDVFISLNGEINASSVGAAHENTLLVGAVFDEHIMVCPI